MIGSLSRRRTGEVKTTQQRVWNGRYYDIWDYRYHNQVPLREQQPALLVNWCEVFVLLAFLFHPVLHLVDERYQRARLQGGTRRGFFNDVLCLTKYLLFESWHHLLDFMLDDAIPMALVNSS